MTHQIAVVPGDGIGREVVPAAVRVLDALDAADASFRFETWPAGDTVRDERGTPLPDETRRAVADADAALFGAAGETAADVILPLREAVGSFANVRPARAYPGVDAVRPETDLVVVRENTEGVYAGIETEITDGVTTTTRVITREASRRIARFAFDHADARAEERGEPQTVTVAHKANVMRETDGQFLDAVSRVAAERGVNYETELMDALATKLVLQPEAYDVICCPNLAGDVVSDLTAGLVGGLGLLASANVGGDGALFEPVHGTAPDIAGQGVANPAAAILSAAHLLSYFDARRDARRVRTAVEETLAEGPRTPDVGGTASTEAMMDAVIERL